MIPFLLTVALTVGGGAPAWSPDRHNGEQFAQVTLEGGRIHLRVTPSTIRQWGPIRLPTTDGRTTTVMVTEFFCRGERPEPGDAPPHGFKAGLGFLRRYPSFEFRRQTRLSLIEIYSDGNGGYLALVTSYESP